MTLTANRSIAVLFAVLAGCAGASEPVLAENSVSEADGGPGPAASAGPIGTPPPATEVIDLPLGRANWVVSNGSLVDHERDNAIRLGTYVFTADGKVAARMWSWDQKHPAMRVGTGTTPAGACTGGNTKARACEILVPDGYLGEPNDVRTGTFTLMSDDKGPYVNIAWNHVPAWGEHWYLSESADHKFASFTFKWSRFANIGFGYGSNAAFETRRAIETVAAHPDDLRYAYTTWAHDVVTTRGAAAPFDPNRYLPCTDSTHCMTFKQMTSTACSCPGSPDTSINYYIQKLSSHDRRDTLWHWCTCLSQGATCYLGNSHVKPLLQVIDDDNNFRGWVGAEASFNVTMHVDPRSHDMLGVFRMVN
jgi:hypothetical protein